jgi:hypothetical protein
MITMHEASAPDASIAIDQQLSIREPKTPRGNKSVARRSAAKQLGYHRIARAGGWGLLVGAIAGVVAAAVPTLLTPWQLVAVGTSFGMSLDYLGLMPSAYRRKLLTKWAKHYNQLVEEGLISDAQRQRQIDALLLKLGP